jgi:hypothetical protein
MMHWPSQWHPPPRRARVTTGGVWLLAAVPRLRFGLDQSKNSYCHNLLGADNCGPSTVGVGPMVRFSAFDHGGSKMPSVAPPRAR